MTLIVGIICKDAIVFGAESETSREVTKYQGAKKLHRVAFKNGWAIVGESGVAHLSSLALNYFKRCATGTEITDEDTIRKTLNTAFRGMAGELGTVIGTLDAQEYYRHSDNYFELTVGYYFNRKPYLYVFKPTHGVAASQNREFALSGIADYLAEYLLKDFKLSELDSHGALIAAAYVVGEVKTAIIGCGGKTEIALMSCDKPPEKVFPPWIEEIESKHLKPFLETISKKRQSSFDEMIKGAVIPYMPVVESFE